MRVITPKLIDSVINVPIEKYKNEFVKRDCFIQTNFETNCYPHLLYCKIQQMPLTKENCV